MTLRVLRHRDGITGNYFTPVTSIIAIPFEARFMT